MNSLAVAADDDQRRVDQLLRKAFRDVPPGALARAVRMGDVRINGKRCSNDSRVSQGDIVTVPLWHRRQAPPRIERVQIRDGAIHLPNRLVVPILSRDADILALNKPAGIATHGPRELDEVVRAAARQEQWCEESVSFRPGPVHRLDRGTSGVQLFALSRGGAQLVTEQITARKSCKFYIAIVTGRVRTTVMVDTPMTYNREKQRAAVPGATTARTRIFPLATAGSGAVSLVGVYPETGRRHQIRAHCAHIGHPLVGDHTYGSTEAHAFFLHALVLSFPALEMRWHAPLNKEQFREFRQLFGDAAPIRQRIVETINALCPGAVNPGIFSL